MITGTVTDDGIPMIMLPVAGQLWRGIIDTGFNGDLELPESLRSLVNARFIGRMTELGFSPPQASPIYGQRLGAFLRGFSRLCPPWLGHESGFREIEHDEDL